jgi:hypothetical protein
MAMKKKHAEQSLRLQWRLKRAYASRLTSGLLLALLSGEVSCGEVGYQKKPARSCELMSEDNGDLFCERSGSRQKIASGFTVDFPMEQTYVMTRADGQFLVSQSYAADHNTIVVPVIDNAGIMAYGRIITFARNRSAPLNESGYRSTGREYVLDKLTPISDFTWEGARETIDLQASRVHKSTGSQAAPPNKSRKGFDLTPTSVYSPDGDRILMRYYVDPSRIGFNVETTTCLIECTLDARATDGEYFGGVGNSSIRGELRFDNGHVTGRYKYDKGNGRYLKVTGEVSPSGEIELREVDPSQRDHVTGSIHGHISGSQINGLWKTPGRVKELPFFFVRSTL